MMGTRVVAEQKREKMIKTPHVRRLSFSWRSPEDSGGQKRIYKW